MKWKYLLEFLILLLFASVVYGADYQIDENMDMNRNDIYNASYVNSTAFYQGGFLVIDTSTVSYTTDTNAKTLCNDNNVLLGQDSTTCINFNDTASALAGDNMTLINLTIDARDSDTTYSHLSNFSDDIGVGADWDAIGDVPTNTPTSGDTANLSLSGQIYSWVFGNPFSWITNTVNDLTNYYLKTETYNNTEIYNKTESDTMNSSMTTFVNAQDVIHNTSVTNYANSLNSSMTTYVNTQDVAYNTTQTNYADSLIAGLTSIYCALAGCTMAGDIAMGGNDITGAADINSTEFYQNGKLVLDSDDSFSGEVSGVYNNLVVGNDVLDDQYIELGDILAGDVSGTYDATVVADSSHLHEYQNISNEPWIEESKEGNLNVNHSDTSDSIINTTERTLFLSTYNSSYLTSYTETDPAWTGNYSSVAFTASQGTWNVNSSDYWDTYDSPAGWDLDSTDDLVDSDFGSAGLMKTNGAGTYSIITDSSTNWNNAFTWTNANHTNWDNAYLNSLIAYRLDSWDNFTGIPTAAPSDGDTTHLSTADQIRDYVIGLGYSTTTGTVTSVATTAPIAGGTITTTGTISLTACADTEIYKYNSSTSAWECEADEGASSYYFNLTADSGTVQQIDSTNVVTIAGGTTGIDTVVSATDTVTLEFDWTEVASDAVAEAKIDMDTVCAAGNHLYVSGNDFACEADDDTTYDFQCSAGDFVKNLTAIGGYVCDTPAGSGDITGVTTNGAYLTGGCLSGTCDLLLNETVLNETIEAYGYSTTTGTVTSVATDDTYLTGGAITTTGTITFNTTLAGTSLAVDSADKWDALNSPSDINAADITNDGTYRLSSWDNFTGIPHATPSNGDVTHFSWADEIYDWVIGLGYSTTTGTVTSIATTAPLSGGTITTSGTLSITNDGIGDTQLAFNTGQHLTTTSNVVHGSLNLTGQLGILQNKVCYDATCAAYEYYNGTCFIRYIGGSTLNHCPP